MKLRTGQPRYKIPPHSKIVSVCVVGNQSHNQMCGFVVQILDMDRIASMPLTPHGMPRYCGIHDEVIAFRPPPDKPYVVTVRYCPPVVEY